MLAKDNLKNKLERELQLPKVVAQEFIHDVFGAPTKLEKGLVDAEDEDTLMAQFASLEEVWNNRESLSTNAEPQFYQWFKLHCYEVVKTSMLKQRRELAGLGSPPSPYYTNAVESINNLLKICTNLKKQDLTIFITKVKDVVDAQFSEEDRAVAGVGEYIVDSKYSKFQYTAAAWCSMSTAHLQKVVKRFRSVPPVVTTATSIASFLTDALQEKDNSASSSCSNPLTSLCITDYVAEQIWTSATTLLADDDNFSVAPGSSKSAWMVSRGEDLKPHFVHQKKGHYECDQDCFYFQTCKVCAHIVAIANRNNDLSKFIEWYKKQNHGINATTVAQIGLPLSLVKRSRRCTKTLKSHPGNSGRGLNLGYHHLVVVCHLQE